MACQLCNDFPPQLLKSMSPGMHSQHPSLLCAALPGSAAKCCSLAPNPSIGTAALPINTSLTYINPLFLFGHHPFSTIWLHSFLYKNIQYSHDSQHAVQCDLPDDFIFQLRDVAIFRPEVLSFYAKYLENGFGLPFIKSNLSWLGFNCIID